MRTCLICLLLLAAPVHANVDPRDRPLSTFGLDARAFSTWMWGRFGVHFDPVDQFFEEYRFPGDDYDDMEGTNDGNAQG